MQYVQLNLAWCDTVWDEFIYHSVIPTGSGVAVVLLK